MRNIGARLQKNVQSMWLPATLLAAIAALATFVACGNNGIDLGEIDAGEEVSDAATAGDVATSRGGDAAIPIADAGGGTTRDGSGAIDSGAGPDGTVPPLLEAGAEAGPDLTGPVYTFGTAINPGSCLDVVSSGTANGTQIDEYTCNATGAQSFYVVDAGGGGVKLVNTNSKTCLDVNGGGAADGTKVQLWGCDDTAAQTFSLAGAGDGFFNIVNTGSSKCLAVAGGNRPTSRTSSSTTATRGPPWSGTRLPLAEASPPRAGSPSSKRGRFSPPTA
jgi:hypothetical protein